MSKLTDSVDDVRILNMEQKDHHSTQRIRKALLKFGLTENEITIYQEAIKQKESSPFTLSKATNIPRTTVYDVLMNLSLKGLVKLQQSDGFTKQQTRITAHNPSILRDILRNKRKELTRTEIDILEILPFLKGEFYGDESHADFRFYPGIEGAKKVLFGEEMDKANIPMYVFDNQMPMDSFGPSEMDKSVDDVNNMKLNKGYIFSKELTVLDDWTKHVITYQYRRDERYIKARELRYIENPILSITLRLAIKGTRVMITSANEDEIWGLIINSKSLSGTLISIFQFLWTQATPVTKEIIESWPDDGYDEFEKLYKASRD